MLLSALFCLACGLSLLLPVALPCSVPSVHPDRAFSASKCITRGSGAGDMGRRSVFGDRGRWGLRAGERLWLGMGVGGAHGRGAGYGPRQEMGSGFFGEFNQAGPCGVSLSGLPADLCRAFLLLSAALPCSVPSAHPGCAFRRLVTLRSVWWRGAAGERRVFEGSGRRGLARRGWVRVFSGNSTGLRLPAFLCRAFRQILAALSNASLLYLTAHPCYPFGFSLPSGRGRGAGLLLVSAPVRPAVSAAGVVEPSPPRTEKSVPRLAPGPDGSPRQSFAPARRGSWHRR